MSETKAKWTPGPWAPGHMVDQDHSCECRYILSDGAGYFGSVAVVSKNNGLRVGDGGNDCPPEEEAIANAHLIAAAPAMAEALDRLLKARHRLVHTSDREWDDARAALALAKGETK